MNKYIRIKILFFLFLTACKYQTREQEKKNEFGGVTKSIMNRESNFVDSIFDHSGNLMKLVEYYRADTTPKSISLFNKDRSERIKVDYYKNKKIRTNRFFFQGKECFERLDYSESGKLSNYSFLSSDQSKLYIRVYDTLGQCIETRGVPFFESYMYGNKNSTFTSDDTVTVNFFAPNPPDCYTKMYTVDEQKEISNIRQLDERFIYGVRIYPLTEGDFEWLVKMKIFDKHSDSLIYSSDVVSITYSVKGKD